MNNTNKKSRMKLAAPLGLALAPLLAGFAPVANAAFDLTGIGYVQYGDAQSYSLPIACIQVGQAYNGCDFNVASTPGQTRIWWFWLLGPTASRSTPILPAWITPTPRQRV